MTMIRWLGDEGSSFVLLSPRTVFRLVLFFVFVPVLAVGLAFAVFAMVVQQFLGCCCQMK
jgi:hypothetical protein